MAEAWLGRIHEILEIGVLDYEGTWVLFQLDYSPSVEISLIVGASLGSVVVEGVGSSLGLCDALASVIFISEEDIEVLELGVNDCCTVAVFVGGLGSAGSSERIEERGVVVRILGNFGGSVFLEGLDVKD